jgi:phytoene synthase
MKYWKKTEHYSAFKYAQKLTAHYSKSFYFSARLLPPEKRWATYALYGFCRFADNLVDNPRNRTKQELLDELDYMQREITYAYRSGDSEHPVLKPFTLAALKYNIPVDYPLDLLKGIRMDITENRYHTFKELYLFCYRVAGVVGLMMTHVLGFRSPLAFRYAEKLGIAMQLTNILRDVQEDKEMGRIYLPLNELRQFGIGEEDIMDENNHEKMHAFMKFQISRAHKYYDEAHKGIALLDKNAQFAIYASSKIYRGILHKIEAREFNPFHGRVYVSQKKKIGILLQEIVRTRLTPAIPVERILQESY